MIIRFTPLIAFMCLSLRVTAQTDTVNIPFVAYWSKGDSYDFMVRKIKTKWDNGVPVKNDTIGYIANFEVLDSTATNYKIAWTYLTHLQQSYDIPPALLDSFSKYEFTRAVYSTSEMGEFRGVDNWKEISVMMTDLISDIADYLSVKKPENKEEFTRMTSTYRDIYSSKEGIEELLFKELQFFHAPLGAQYALRDTLYWEEKLTNMLGGEPIRGDARLYMEQESYDPGNEFCVMIQEMTLNNEDTKKLVVEFLKRTGLDETSFEEELNKAAFSINDHNRFEYYYYPGLPTYIETTRDTNLKIRQTAMRQTETITIELLASDN
jgi:hypothetical protein